MAQVDEPSMSQGDIQESPEELDRRNVQADMERVRFMSVERRREVAFMDMMGEYGSKVSG